MSTEYNIWLLPQLCFDLEGKYNYNKFLNKENRLRTQGLKYGHMEKKIEGLKL